MKQRTIVGYFCIFDNYSKKMAQNLKINYLYRDAGNYKHYGSVIFTNKGNLDMLYMENLLRSKLISGEYFIASEWGFPDLYFETTTEDDHCWHEFLNIEPTNETGLIDIIFFTHNNPYKI